MTDDEKMLLVAKACGWTLENVEGSVICAELGRSGRRFNPLHNANDMLEILSNLGLSLMADRESKLAWCHVKAGSPHFYFQTIVPANGNMKAALCRAVFEVAAKIGETL